jgi:hypothetical protein
MSACRAVRVLMDGLRNHHKSLHACSRVLQVAPHYARKRLTDRCNRATKSVQSISKPGESGARNFFPWINFTVAKITVDTIWKESSLQACWSPRSAIKNDRDPASCHIRHLFIIKLVEPVMTRLIPSRARLRAVCRCSVRTSGCGRDTQRPRPSPRHHQRGAC